MWKDKGKWDERVSRLAACMERAAKLEDLRHAQGDTVLGCCRDYGSLVDRNQEAMRAMGEAADASCLDSLA